MVMIVSYLRSVAEKIYNDENDKDVLNQQVKQQHGKFTRAHVPNETFLQLTQLLRQCI